MTGLVENITTLMIQYGLNFLWAIIIFLIGRWVAGLVSKIVRRALAKAKVNPTIINFATSLTYIGLVIFTVMAALSRLGVQTASFVAVIGAAGLAVGLALQGSLANFAAGILILFFKPFTVGDFVEVAGEFGKVESIQIFNSVVITPDNKTVIIPNGQITAGNIINYSTKGMIRLDMVFGIGYTDDLLKAKRILEEIITADPRVLKDPSPTIAVLELADNSVNFAVRPFVTVEDYWAVHFATHEQVKLRFDKEGISIPFPQRDVHLFQEK